ncbi:hypothetical protein UFOVP704_27 [uncultured Caudovirales phage]|uniref:Uncharacterized protein n=1 Tax=uncultured Caudovirales phage TaxID=2100421 RepID=A0A6J5NNT5_9CAUD|nr:hypothetical protein UFOVP704_27 [uncultured Caudovirales phage]
MPQELDHDIKSFLRPRKFPKDAMTKKDTDAEVKAMHGNKTGNKTGRGYVVSGEQDIKRFSGFVERQQGKPSSGRQTDSTSENRYLSEQTAKMKAAMAKRKAANTSPAPKGRKTMGALLGIAGAAQAMKNRGR